MRDFDDELRAGLSRTAGDAPRPEGIPEGTLRRARRRRIANTALTGVLAMGLAFGGFVGVRAAMEVAAPVAEQRPADERPVVGPTPTPSRAPSPSPSPSPEPTEPSASSPEPRLEPVEMFCNRYEGGSDEVFPDFVDVSLGGSPYGPEQVELDGSPESVTFHFEPMEGQTEAPWHIIRFTDRLVTDGEGAPVEVGGTRFVAVTFMARGVDFSGEEVIAIYTGPKEIVHDGGTIVEIEQTGDFEGMVSWGIGLTGKACYAVDAGPEHLTITFFR